VTHAAKYQRSDRSGPHPRRSFGGVSHGRRTLFARDKVAFGGDLHFAGVGLTALAAHRSAS